MIPQITETNFPSYATLSNATVSLSDMGDRTINTQVRIDGDIVPDFSGWELQFRGERFVLDIKDPQAVKDNSTRNSIIDLTFHSWAILQLKRYFMFTVQQTATGVITADKYNASVSLNLNNFCALMNQVLEHYFGAQIYIDLNSERTYESEPAIFEINYTHIWDVMTQIYDIYGVRWRIEHVTEPTDAYVFKVGYDEPEISDHVFEYGFQGGLMRFERQVQDSNIANILLGRGGEKNVPYRYFKRTDPQNPDWAADPDAIPELANIYFDRIRDAAFRWYVRGWMTNPTENRDDSWDETYTYPTYDIGPDHPFYWAYHKGATDENFDPVEYVKDDDSIAKYGEKWGHVDDNDDIFPTIQSVMLDGGRADLTLAVSTIDDDVEEASAKEATRVDLSYGKTFQTNDLEPTPSDLDLQIETIQGDKFTVPTGMTANLMNNGVFVTADVTSTKLALIVAVEDRCNIKVYRTSDDVQVPTQGITAGEYYYVLTIAIRNGTGAIVPNATYGYNGLWLDLSPTGGEGWKPTFDIWIRNVFSSSQQTGETADEYALRVWQQVLGDHLGNEAAIAFSDGFMSISEDYTFKIASYPVMDRSVTYQGFQSEWKLTLYKSDAEYDATGKYIPNTTTGGRPIAGDHFYFIGIDLPNFYVTDAEERLTNYKIEQLYDVSEIQPTWVVSLDKVRLDQEYNADQERLFDKIDAGAKLYFADKRFTNNSEIALYASTVTFTWSDDTVILPQTEVVLTDKVYVSRDVIASINGDIKNLRSSIAQMSDVSHVIREQIKPLFLEKTGEEQTSLSPTKFTSLLTSGDFQQGGFGGKGWGFYRDNSMAYQDLLVTPIQRRLQRSVGAALRSGESDGQQAVPSVHAGAQSVLEIDRLIVRRDMQVNNLVINQIAYVGGMQIISAAAIECTQVVENDDSYDCFFDQKQGTVKNLFQVNDVALGQVFTPENTRLRFYKRKVIKVGIDYIRLSKSVAATSSAAPAKGDVIVQFGNYENEDRRYVIIRDVIGGGYEQMLSDLDNVDASGVEYYFAGINGAASGDREDLADSQGKILHDSDDKKLTVIGQSKPRFFVGDPDSKLEYTARDKTVRVKGVISQSPSGVEFPITTFREDGDYDATKWYYYGDLVVYNGEGWVHIGKERTKGTAPTTGNVWRLYTARGEAYYRIDLTNENAMINADSDGNILTGAVRPTCTASLFYGTGAVPNPTYSISVPQAQNVQGVSINSSTGDLTFNRGDQATPFNFDGTSLRITVTGTATVDGQSVSASEDMIVTKVIPGAEGEPATSYWLVLSSDKVAVNPNTNPETIQPADVTPTAMLQVGEDAPRAAVAADNLSITYQYDSETEAALPASGKVMIATKNASQQRRYNLHFYLKKTEDNVATVVDQEAVPILYDGVNGESALVADLSNETDGIAVGSDGILTASPTPLVTKAKMYLGNVAQSISSVTVDLTNVPSAWKTGANPQFAVAVTDTSTGAIEKTITFTITASTSAPLDFSSISVLEIPIQIACAKGTRTLTYSLLPVKEGEDGTVFKLVPSADVIKGTRNNDGTVSYDPDEISCARMMRSGSGDLGTTTYGYLRMSTDGGQNKDAYSAIDDEDSEWEDMVEAGRIIYYWYSDLSYTHLIDRETVPVVVDGEKGGTGNSGKTQRGPSGFSTRGYAGDSNTPYQGLLDPFDATHTYYDVVTRPGLQAGTTRLFYCQHESKMVDNTETFANEIYPEQDSGTESERCWIEADVFEFVATKVFLAQNAQIDFLSGNDILVKNAQAAVVAGMLGGTGVNFFAGGTKSQAEAGTAPFRVMNDGKVYASDAVIGGTVLASGTQTIGGQTRSGLASLNGLFVQQGSSFLGGNANVSGDLVAESSGENSQHRLLAGYGNEHAKLQLSGTGLATLESVDGTNKARIELLGTNNDATLTRGSGSAESIVTSGSIKHIVECSQSDYPQNPDANTLYIII